MSEMLQVNQKIGIEEELEQIRNDMFSRLNKALHTFKGKTVMVDIWNGIMMDKYLPEFDFNCFPNCKDQLLLNFKDEDENISGVTIKLDDIEDIEISDNLDEYEELYDGETEYYVDDIIIYLEIGLVIRLELQW